jgi:hypothetical protein
MLHCWGESNPETKAIRHPHDLISFRILNSSIESSNIHVNLPDMIKFITDFDRVFSYHIKLFQWVRVLRVLYISNMLYEH